MSSDRGIGKKTQVGRLGNARQDLGLLESVTARPGITGSGRSLRRSLDPGGQGPETFEVIGDPGGRIEVERVENPRPDSSWGFGGDPVCVSAGGVFRPVTLKLALDEEHLRTVNRATIRIFRFDETAGDWRLVKASGSAARTAA